jgi:hypothetical protein
MLSLGRIRWSGWCKARPLLLCSCVMLHTESNTHMTAQGGRTSFRPLSTVTTFFSLRPALCRNSCIKRTHNVVPAADTRQCCDTIIRSAGAAAATNDCGVLNGYAGLRLCSTHPQLHHGKLALARRPHCNIVHLECCLHALHLLRLHTMAHMIWEESAAAHFVGRGL